MADSDKIYSHEEMATEKVAAPRDVYRVAGHPDGEVYTPLEDTPKNRRKIALALDIRILPMLALLWLMAFIDRSNIGNARVAGLESSLNLMGNQYQVSLAVFYILYIVVEIPSNLALKRVGGHIWLPAIVTAWGVVTTLTCLVNTYGGLIALRLMLGLCEGGVLPGIVYYLSMLYPRHELQLRIGIFYAASSLSGAFGGLLAAALLKMNGIANLAGWRWIFIIEGIATVLAGCAAFFVLPKSLETAKFLSPEQRELAVRRLTDSFKPAAKIITDEKAQRDQIERAPLLAPEKFEWREVSRGLAEPQVWFTGFGYMAICTALYSFSLFLPTILGALGNSGTHLQLLTVPVYCPAAALCVVVAYCSDRLKQRGVFILGLLPISMVGYIMLIVSRDNNVRYGAVFLVALGLYPAVPCLLAWLSNNTGGSYKRATCTALQLMLCNLAGFPASFLYQTRWAPNYVQAHGAVLAFLGFGWLCYAANLLWVIRENRLRRAGKRDSNIEEYEQLVDEGKTTAPIGDRSPEFIMSL